MKIGNKITSIRLCSHHLTEKRLATPRELVAWMGAVQAQDFNASKGAIGVRLTNVTESTIVEAFNKGEILRTHVLRPTWHLVTPEDIRGMLALSAERIKASSRSRDKQLEITENLYEQTDNIIRNALKGNKQLTKSEIATELEQHKICTDTARLYHFLMRAEVNAIICSGALKGKEQTYALLDERAAVGKTLPVDEARDKLFRTYIRSHCPATLQDFSWWSGLPLSDARKALESAQPHLYEEKIDGKSYWIDNDFRDATVAAPSVFLLPAFDEYIIAYRDRSAVISNENHSKAVSSNGVFRPTIIVNGQVGGLWKTGGAKKNVVLDWFEQPDKQVMEMTEAAKKCLSLTNETVTNCNQLKLPANVLSIDNE